MRLADQLSLRLGPRGGVALPFAGHATLLTGLISYYKMDETSGVRYDSILTSANDLTDNNTVTSATGMKDNAASFTAGNSEYLSTANTLAAADADFSISVWAKVASEGTLTICNDANGDFLLRSSSGNVDLFTRSFADNVFDSTHTFVVGTWSHVIAWHDSVNNVIGLVVDGNTAVTTGTGGTNGAIDTFFVGARSAILQFFDGDIDEFGVWTKVLSTQERSDLYNSGSGLFY